MIKTTKTEINLLYEQAGAYVVFNDIEDEAPRSPRGPRPVDYDEVHKYGGGLRCNTMQPVGDPAPKTFD